VYVRLAFAAAAHLETEILRVNKVLAVVDAAHEGRTVLFVSHNRLSANGLCTRAICLQDGKAILEGAPSFVASTSPRN